MNEPDELQRTFDTLRRSSYIDACVAYTMAGMDLPVGTTSEQRMKICIEAIEALGWTDDELTEEGWRRERAGL